MPRRWIAFGRALPCALLVVLGLSGQALAQSPYTLPPAVDANIANGTVPNYVYVNGASQEVADHVCNQVCQRLRAARNAPMPNEAGAAAVRREEFALMQRAGVAPYLRAAGTIGLGVEAFALGWKIGTGIRTKFIDVEVPATDAVTGLYQHYENSRLEPARTTPSRTISLVNSQVSVIRPAADRPTPSTTARTALVRRSSCSMTRSPTTCSTRSPWRSARTTQAGGHRSH